MNVGKIISKRRIELGLTLEQVGDAVGVSKSTVKKWEDGYISNMRRDRIAELARVLQISPVSLITGKEDDTTASSAQYSNIFPIQPKKYPLLGEIACGKPIFADEDRESYVMSGTAVKADFCLRAKGDSMINARIYDGDIVFIREQPMVNNGEIAAVIIGDEATLKRVTYFPEKAMLILKAENPLYEDMVFMGDELETIRILGKAVSFQSDVR